MQIGCSAKVCGVVRRGALRCVMLCVLCLSSPVFRPFFPFSFLLSLLGLALLVLASLLWGWSAPSRAEWDSKGNKQQQQQRTIYDMTQQHNIHQHRMRVRGGNKEQSGWLQPIQPRHRLTSQLKRSEIQDSVELNKKR